jgi:hypothetical protein
MMSQGAVADHRLHRFASLQGWITVIEFGHPIAVRGSGFVQAANQHSRGRRFTGAYGKNGVFSLHAAGVTGSIPVPPTMITGARSGHIGLDWAPDSLSYPVHRGPLTARFDEGRCAIRIQCFRSLPEHRFGPVHGLHRMVKTGQPLALRP